MAAPPSALAASLRDRYRLEREPGRGGMATVWLAHDLLHERPVALKLILPELVGAIGVDRFLPEIRPRAPRGCQRTCPNRSHRHRRPGA